MLERLIDLTASILFRRRARHFAGPARERRQHQPPVRCGAWRLAVAFAAIAATPSVFAQPTQPVDLVTNGDFTTSTAGWTAATGAGAGSSAVAGYTAADGSPTAGAATVGGFQNGAGGTDMVWSQCVALANVPLPWTLGGRTRVAAFDNSGGCGFFYSLRARLFSSANCTGSEVLRAATQQGMAAGVIGPFMLWGGSTAADPHLAVGGTQTARVELWGSIGCPTPDGGAFGTLHYDRVYFGHFPGIFANGFE